jgi:hypothetical protein
MPRLNVIAECRACGEPSEGRYCPACIEERNQVTDRQRVSARQYEENDGGQA